MKFTVLGSTGFIGNALVKNFKKKGYDIFTPRRGIESLAGNDLGHVIYSIGMTGNFRQNPQEAIEAHVSVLQRYLKDASFESWLYLSSTRVYGTAANTTSEDDPVSIMPSADSLYDLSKLMGESLCLSAENNTMRVARLSNVYGQGQNENMFLGSILGDLKRTGNAVIRESPSSSKNYIHISDAIEVLEKISLYGKQKIYNVASIKNTSHDEIAEALRYHGYKIDFFPNARTRIFSSINISRIQREFGISPLPLIEKIPALLKDFS